MHRLRQRSDPLPDRVRTGQDRLGHVRAEQNRIGKDRTGKDRRTGQVRVEQSMTG